jgi:hypothetical protein
MAQGIGRLVETLSSDVVGGGCGSLFPSVRGTVQMSSRTCPEAVLRHALYLLTERCGSSETYMLWLKDWCAAFPSAWCHSCKLFGAAANLQAENPQSGGHQAPNVLVAVITMVFI